MQVSPPSFVSRCLAATALAVLAAGGCREQKPAAPVAPVLSEVVVTTPRTARLPEYLEVTARIDAELVVDIRSRVTGYLTKVAFRDGQFVSKGDSLYEIDARPYQAELAAAAGAIERLLGEEKFLKVQVERFEKLVAKGAASKQEFDSYTAKLEENRGSLAAARAQHEAARLNVEFCSISSPITGQISRTQLQVGNLITQDTTSLTTIVSIDPIFVYFNVDEPTFVRMTAHARKSGRGPGVGGGETIVDVGLVDDVDRTYPHRSRIDFLNNQVDVNTATITMRGRLANPYSSEPKAPRPPLFRPGMFARIRLPLGDAVERLFVPEAAVGNNQDRKILWIVGPDDVASAREVTVGQKLGTWIAVSASDPAHPLAASDRIVVRGLQRCREGKSVKPTDADTDSLGLKNFVVPDTVKPGEPAGPAKPGASAGAGEPAASAEPSRPATPSGQAVPPAESQPAAAAERLPAPPEKPR